MKRRNAVSAAKSRASKSGSSGESVVNEYNKAAKLQGVAVLTKIPTPTTWTKTGLKYTERSTVDYYGFARGGVSLIVEVKTVTSKDVFYLSEVEENQRRHLEEARLFNAIPVLVVVFGIERAVCQIPWWWARGKVSISRDELLEFRVKPQDYMTRFLPENIGREYIAQIGALADRGDTQPVASIKVPARRAR